MTVSNKIVIEVAKAKNILYIHSSFCPLFGEKVNLIYVLQFVFNDLQHLLISLKRSLEYFHDVELLYPVDKFQTFWIFKMFTCLKSISLYQRPTQSWGLNLNMWTYWGSKIFEICQMLLRLFCLNKDQFWFLRMLRTFSTKVWQIKIQLGNSNCSATITLIGVTKVANER